MPPTSAERQVTILNAKGLHMRPATRFVALASEFQADIRVVGNGKDVDGKSILDMTTLAAECGSTLTIRAGGPDAEAAVSALADLVAAQFHMLADGDHDPVDPAGRTEPGLPGIHRQPGRFSVPERFGSPRVRLMIGLILSILGYLLFGGIGVDIDAAPQDRSFNFVAAAGLAIGGAWLMHTAFMRRR